MGRTRRRGPRPDTIRIEISVDDRTILHTLKQHHDEPIHAILHRLIMAYCKDHPPLLVYPVLSKEQEEDFGPH